MHLKLLKVKSKTRQPALIFQRHIFGGAHLEGYDHQIQTRPRFLYNAPTPKFHILCLLIQKLSCWQTNTQTNRRR